MAKITVDIEALQEVLDEMIEDGYVTVQLTLIGDTYTNELKVDAYSIEESGYIDYGSIEETTEELIF